MAFKHTFVLMLFTSPLWASAEHFCNTTYEVKHACEGSTLSLECGPGKVISIISAVYGRQNKTICGNSDTVDCNSRRSLSTVRQRCESKNSCTMTAYNGYFNDACPGVSKYLLVNYTCYSLTSASDQNNSPDCPDGGWYFRDRCYWLIKEPTRSWDDANSYCSKKGTDLQLAIIKDQETNDFLETVLCETGTASAWIGASDIQQDRQFRWVDGSFVNQTVARWALDQPKKTSFSDGVYITPFPELRWFTSPALSTRKSFVCSQLYEQPVCPNGGTFFRDRCYWQGGQGSLTWHEADEACQDEFGPKVRLPVIRDADVNRFLTRFSATGPLWIGLHDTKQERKWVWIDGTELVYSQWTPGEPNDVRGEDCATILSTGNWNDDSCHSYHRYMCALPPCVERVFEDEGSGFFDPGNFSESTCSTTCTCVSTAACFHDGSCRCLPEFEGMVCDTAYFSMSVSQPESLKTGDNVTLTCKVNIPLSDVTLTWTKAGTKTSKFMRGHLHAHKGTSELVLRDIRPKDFGMYICMGRYSTGFNTVVAMESTVVKSEDDTVNLDALTEDTDVKGPSYKGMVIGVALLAIVFVVLLVVIIFLKKRGNSLTV